MTEKPLPRLAVTMGDPAGIGPELCVRLLAEPRVLARCVPVVFGDSAVMRRAGDAGGLAWPSGVDIRSAVESLDDLRGVERPCILDFRAVDAAAVAPGKVDAACGRAAFQYIEAAISAALARDVAAVVTAPIHKEALRAAGVPFPGHTEILADRTGTENFCMMLTSEKITVSLVTTHVGLCDVPGQITAERIGRVIDLTADAMRRIRGRRPRLVVCALNPHAGEGGLFGRGEEERLISVAVDAARERGIEIIGPLPPDTAFLPERLAWADAHVCMYHDQGLVPLKMLAFDEGVNVTLGLPIVRTSVDHGTAMDIAWKGVARVESLVQAALLAERLSRQEP